MARGDPFFARWDLSMFMHPALRSLPNGTARWFYFTCYCAAVEARSETLPPVFNTRSLADRAGIDIRSAKIAYKVACNVGLMAERPDGLIHVAGVRRNHLKLDWQEYGAPSPYGSDLGHKKRVEEEVELEIEGEGEGEGRNGNGKGKPEPQPKRETTPKRKTAALGDDDWIASIKEQYAKIGVDVDAEAVKARAWLLNKPGRQFTRQFFVNWLNRADRTVDPKKASIDYSKGF